MRAIYDGHEPKLLQATAFVEALGKNEDFWAEIATRPCFTHTALDPPEVVRRLRSATAPIRVKLWTPTRGSYPKTVAVTDTRYPRTLFYNTRKLWRTVGEIVNTIVHEFVHNVDLFDDGSPALEYGHGDQRAARKRDSAPYWIGALAERRYEAAHGEPLQVERADVAAEDIVDEPWAPPSG